MEDMMLKVKEVFDFGVRFLLCVFVYWVYFELFVYLDMFCFEGGEMGMFIDYYNTYDKCFKRFRCGN